MVLIVITGFSFIFILQGCESQQTKLEADKLKRETEVVAQDKAEEEQRHENIKRIKEELKKPSRPDPF